MCFELAKAAPMKPQITATTYPKQYLYYPDCLKAIKTYNPIAARGVVIQKRMN